MKTFSYGRADTVDAALDALQQSDTQLIAGGTELVNWLKEGIESPRHVVDIANLPLSGIELTGSGMWIGALARMSEVEAHPGVRREFPLVADALLRSASAQLRNMATIGGNLLQRTRCPYFRADVAMPCNKRAAGSGCAALAGGDTSAHSIFGWSERCAATHPSDLAVALAALDASVEVSSRRGDRRIPVSSIHRLPDQHPELHTELSPDELITGVTVAGDPTARRSHYLKVRERASYEFAVVSAAVSVAMTGSTITSARIALGGVAPRPWRLWNAEAEMEGLDVRDTDGLRTAVAGSFSEARPLPDNGFKVELAQRAAVRAIQNAGGVR
jgi:xanthine dehydrogenase YagS FAD-binding subunit